MLLEYSNSTKVKNIYNTNILLWELLLHIFERTIADSDKIFYLGNGQIGFGGFDDSINGNFPMCINVLL